MLIKKIFKKVRTNFNLRKVKTTKSIFFVKKILYDVKKKGDKAVIRYEKKFSNIKSKKKN